MSKTIMRTGESSPEGGFPAVGNWRTRRGERFETVIVPLKVHYKSTRSLSNSKAVMVF